MFSRHRAAAAGIGFAAFVQLHHLAYEQYARARLGDRALSRLVVSRVLRHAELSWSSALSGDPSSFTWRVLRDSVTQARSEAGLAPADELHRVLPDRAADAALLHERLGMPAKAAAELMGLHEPELHVDLMVARRMLADLGNRNNTDPGGCTR